MADIQFTSAMDGGESIEREYQKMIRVNARLREELSQLATMSRKNFEADQEGRRIQVADAKAAEAIIGKLMTREEKHAASIANLNRLRKAGHLTAEQHARATNAEAAAYQKAMQPAESFAAALEQAGANTFRLNAAMSAGMKVIGLLRSEYDALIARQDKAASAQITLAAAQENALGNLDQSLTPAAFLARMRSESGKLGIDEAKLTTAAASALSAKGDKSATAAVDAVVAASQFKRFGSAEESAGLAGTALDFGKAFNMTPQAALGFLAQTQKTARVVSAQGMSENIAPGIIAGANFGVTPQVSGAIAAALSSGAVDVTGAQTGTAMPALFGQLREFNPRQTVTETLRQIQGSATLRTEFLSKASFERKMQAPVEQLLTPGTQGNREFQNALQAFNQQTPLQAFDAELAKKRASPALNIATLQQRGSNVANQIALDDTSGATSGVIRQILQGVREARGGSAVGSRLSAVLDDLRTGGTQTVESAISAVQFEKDRIELESRVVGGGTGQFGDQGTVVQSRKKLSPEETLLLSRLDSLITILSEQAAVERDRLAVGTVQGRRNNQGEAGP